VIQIWDNRSVDELRNLALFVEVARTSSFRSAGASLGVPNTTVSRRIADLERELGVRLFNRTTRRVELTEAGRLYNEHCNRILLEARRAHEELSQLQVEPHGHLRVAAPADFSAQFIAPLILDFVTLYPKVSIEMELSQSLVDLLSGTVNVAIRMGEPTDSNFIARRLGSFPRAYYASPGYLRRRGTPSHPQDLLEHDCLMMTQSSQSVWRCQRSGEADVETLELKRRITANSPGFLYQVGLQGGGVFWTSVAAAHRDVEDGRLVQVLPDWSPGPQSVHALTATRLLPAKTRAFIDFLAERLPRS
jgi:DNA-binding transcriptional LysR family regulator